MTEPTTEEIRHKRMTGRCMQCGCLNTIAYQNVRNKLVTSYRQFENVKITVDLMLYYCDTCGNTPMYSEDIKRLDEAALESTAHMLMGMMYLVKDGDKYVAQHVSGKSEYLTSNIMDAIVVNHDENVRMDYNSVRTRPAEQWTIPLFSEFHNAGINKRVFVDMIKNTIELCSNEGRKHDK